MGELRPPVNMNISFRIVATARIGGDHHELFFIEQFNNKVGAAFWAIENRGIEVAILNALHNLCRCIHLGMEGDVGLGAVHPDQPVGK